MLNPFRPFFAKPIRDKSPVRFIHIDGNAYLPSISSPTGVEFFTEDNNAFRFCPEGHIAPNGVPVLQIAIALCLINGNVASLPSQAASILATAVKFSGPLD